MLNFFWPSPSIVSFNGPKKSQALLKALILCRDHLECLKWSHLVIFNGWFNNFPPHLQHMDINSYNYLCTYNLYSPVHNVLDACISTTWGSGRGWALEFPFLGLWNWNEPIGEFHLGPEKLGNSRAQLPATSPSNGYALGYNDFNNLVMQTLSWLPNKILRLIHKIRFSFFWAVCCACAIKVYKKCQ
jgi:hypothetical protein